MAKRTPDNPHGFDEGDIAYTKDGRLITIAQCGNRHCYDRLEQPHRLSELSPVPVVSPKTYEQLSLLGGGSDA